MKVRITIPELKFYARHGLIPQEQIVGANFFVSLDVVVNVSEKALLQDDIEGTVNYATLCDVVKEEMMTSSLLIEHIAHRIAQRILNEFSRVEEVNIHLEKGNPPVNVHCRRIGIKLSLKRHS